MSFPKLIAISAIAIATMSGAAFSQEGGIYSFHSKPRGDCPGPDWHVVQGSRGSLYGMISWNDMKSLARATGTVVNQQVKMTATEKGGQGRTATIEVACHAWRILRQHQGTGLHVQGNHNPLSIRAQAAAVVADSTNPGSGSTV